jgi:acyl-CoA dehydrogenase
VSDVDGLVRHILDREFEAASMPTAARLWDVLDTSGLTRVGIAEDVGGAGGSRDDAATIVTRCAQRAVSLPLVEAQLVWAHAAGQTRTPVPDGRLTVALPARLDATRVLGGWRLDGVATRVAYGRSADAVLAVVPVDPDQILLARLETYEVHPAESLAGEERDDLYLDGIVAADGEATLQPVRLGEDLLYLAALGRSGQMLGAMRTCLDLTIGFARLREQFGRPIAAQQAVAHQIVEMAAEVAATEAGVAAALAQLGSAGPLDDAMRFAVGAARVAASRAATRVAAIAHQVHGAIGMTAEHQLHDYTTRLWSWRDEYGSERSWCERLAGLVGDGDELWAMMTGCPAPGST